MESFEKKDNAASTDDRGEVLNMSELLNSTNASSSSDGAEHKLDLSSLNVGEPVDDSLHDDKNIELFNDVVSKICSGELEIEVGIKLLKDDAQNNRSAQSWLCLGQIYSNNALAVYNPALAFDCYGMAAELGNGDAKYDLGICYHKGFGCQQDDALAVQCFSSGANELHLECICALGICYEFGIGCETDHSCAFNLYEKGAELGHAKATNNLGGCYFYGHGVEKNKEKAIELYRRAAELGDSSAECRLGICFENGDGFEKDLNAAFAHYKRAAELGNATAAYRLAVCYDSGIGTEQNFNKAFKYYDSAATLGFTQAKYEAGKMRMLGHGTKKDPDGAYRLFASAVDDGFVPAKYELASCLFEGKGIIRNRINAYKYFLESYDEDDSHRAEAAYKLGLCCLKGLGTAENKNDAVKWLTVGAELGSAEASYMLGECFHYGVGTNQNDEKAAQCYIQAMSYIDNSRADGEKYVPLTLAMAYCYENGAGVEADKTKALYLYKRAAESNDAEAAYRAGSAIMAGVGMRAEYAAARPYILRAARKSFVPAMLTMGRLSDEGKGVKKNLDDAKSWYVKTVSAEISSTVPLYSFPERFAESQKLCIDAKTEAQYRLGMLTARYKPTFQSYIEAFEHIAASAAMGYAPAQEEITKIHVSGGDLRAYYEGTESEANKEHGTVNIGKDTLAAAMNKLGDSFFDGKNLLKKNEAVAARCYKFAAELGQTEACYSYGWCLRHGVGVRESDAEAIKWLKLAADRGNSNAAYSYGLCCEEGAGTGVKNKREALYYYRMAAAAGHSDAAQRYSIISERDIG